MSERSRILWRCRRGIKEMDILFEKFMEQCYESLHDDEKKAFEKFLDESDLDILAWIMNKSETDNPAYKILVGHFQKLDDILS